MRHIMLTIAIICFSSISIGSANAETLTIDSGGAKFIYKSQGVKVVKVTNSPEIKEPIRTPILASN